jgi:hypothetical protein
MSIDFHSLDDNSLSEEKKDELFNNSEIFETSSDNYFESLTISASPHKSNDEDDLFDDDDFDDDDEFDDDEDFDDDDEDEKEVSLDDEKLEKEFYEEDFDFDEEDDDDDDDFIDDDDEFDDDDF